MPGVRPRLGSRRIHRGIPRRGSWSEHGADRTLRDARRSLSQRRLHSVEGLAARIAIDRRSRTRGRHRHHVRRTEDRHRETGRVQGQSCRATHGRPGQHGQAAQGERGARCRRVRLAERNRSRNEGRQKTHPLRKVHHRGRIAIGEAARISVGRCAHDGFDRRAPAERRAEETARRRRRHHRAGNGVRL